MASHEQSYRAGESHGRAEVYISYDQFIFRINGSNFPDWLLMYLLPEQEKTGRVTGSIKEKAREVKDKTYETAQQAKEKAAQTAQEAREKTAETTESAKQKAQEGKDNSKGVMQQTGEKVMQMAESAKDTVKQTLGIGGPGEDEDIYARKDETEDPAGYKHTTIYKETKY